ncbi:MAG TPA: tetraacyldisaccharide 4'-kinase [Usitatibacter sp.]|nr:tetraacyldisaccharide 4'-kinase [Usitatibacter sp.]
MRAWLEREWQRRGGGALVLLPLAFVFAAAVRVRRVLYRRRVLPAWRAGVPVVVVGNVTVGGTGKTPLVIAIVERLRAHGWNPGVVARGYGRVPPREQDPLGVVRVLPDVATPEHFGDEPVLIARRSRVPVYISPDRAAAARALLAADLGVDVLVCDDGLQHYALARDVEIAVVDGERRFGNGLPLPAGPLREPVARLAEVDAVVVNGASDVVLPCERRFTMRLAGERFVSLATGEQRAPQEFALAVRGRRVAAVAGIGHPQRFFDHLSALGIRAEGHAFADHHAYQKRDLKLPGAEIVLMTEKDAVKCMGFADARMWFMRVDAVLPPEFDELLLDRIAAARRERNGSQAA